MRADLLETSLRGKGRKLNHVEDFLTFYGSAGGREILDVFSNLDRAAFTLKWDGRVAVHFGRDGSGRFALGTKAMWDRYKAPGSAGELHGLFMSGGRGEHWRPALADALAAVFDLVRDSTPADFRGFVMGDVLYCPGMPLQRGGEWLTFTPNRVTYSVREGSALGQAMRGTSAGIALHTYHNSWSDDRCTYVDEGIASLLGGGGAAFIPPVGAGAVPQASERNLGDLAAILDRSGSDFDWLIQERKGLKDFSAVVYRYTNHLAKTRTWDGMSADDFFEWVAAESGFTEAKIGKIGNIHRENPRAFDALFPALRGISAMKDDVIGQLDGAGGDIRESTGGEEGGEGYVLLERAMKFVPRRRWIPEERARAMA